MKRKKSVIIIALSLIIIIINAMVFSSCEQRCPSCFYQDENGFVHMSGNCKSCKGSGTISFYSTTQGKWIYSECSSCGGSGKCSNCNGTGKIPF